MDISSVDRTRVPEATQKSEKIRVAQKTIEAARQNQASNETVKTGSAKKFAHPYLGHNIDIYV